MGYLVLVINPGSTSTKIAVFDGEKRLFQETLRHTQRELEPFAHVTDQVDFRREVIEKVLAEHQFDLSMLDAVCARGGQLPPCPSGAFVVDEQMVEYMRAIVQGAHASNLGCIIAKSIADAQNIPAYVYDPVGVDEMEPVARITGMPMLNRWMVGHSLNTRAMALRCADEVMHKPLEQCRFIVLHLGGGASVRLFIGGKMVDDVRDDELLFAPERSGGQDCHRNGTGTGRGGLAAGVASLIALDGRGGSRDCHAQTQDERENKGYKLSHCDFSFSVKM